MLLHFWLSNDGRNVPLFVDTKGGAVRSVVFTPHEFLESPHPKGVLKAVVFVHKKVKREVKLVYEFFVGSGMVDAHAEDGDVVGLEFSHSVSETACLVGAARGVVLGIEIQGDPFATIVLEGVGLIVLVES